MNPATLRQALETRRQITVRPRTEAYPEPYSILIVDAARAVALPILERDEELAERVAGAIIDALHQLVDITVEPYTWDRSVDEAVQAVFTVLNPWSI